MLSPYRVLDLTDRDGWLFGFLLAQLGAEVLLVEPPGGYERDSWFEAYNRGKQSVVEADDETLGELAASCDMVVANGAPAGLAFLDDLRAADPSRRTKVQPYSRARATVKSQSADPRPYLPMSLRLRSR